MRKINSNINELRGNPGKRKQGTTTVSSPSNLEVPKMQNSYAKKHCSKMAQYFNDEGISISVDQVAFSRYCKYMDLFYRAMDEVDQDGLCVQDTIGALRKHPNLQVLREAESVCSAFEKRYLAPPVDRIPDKEEVDPLEDFLSDGKPKVLSGGKK